MIFLLWFAHSSVFEMFVLLRFKSRPDCCKLAAICGAFAVAMFGTCRVGLGQTFDGYQSTQSVVVSTGLSSPQQVAVDKLGNVYIADAGNNRILMETPSGGGYTQSTVPSSSLNGPVGVAVDGNRNVYIADSSNGRVLKETLSGGHYTESIVSASGPHRNPQCLAVDGQGNVFVVDPEYAALFKETPSGNTYIETIIPVQYNSTGNATEVAVDQSGNLYVTTSGSANGPVALKLIPSGNSYVVSAEVTQIIALSVAVDNNGHVFLGQNGVGVREESQWQSLYLGLTVDENIGFASGIAADSNGNLYVADHKNNRVVKDRLWGGDFGSVGIGMQSSALSLIFRNYKLYPVAMGAPKVVTQGVAGLDFADAGTGSCTTNGPAHTYAYSATCTVDVILTPKTAGPRSGAVNLTDSSGNVVASGLVRGTGTGPQINFPPGVQSTISLNSTLSPGAIAVDAAHNLYVLEEDPNNIAIYALVKESWTGSGYAPSTISTSGFVGPVGIAIDGAGNIYVADQNGFELWKVTPTGTGYSQAVLFSNMSNVESVAVDGSGNIYLATAVGAVKETFIDGEYSESSIDPTVSASGIAVDTSGDVFLTDHANGLVLKEAPTGNTYTQAVVTKNLANPTALAVDGNGNIYVVNEELPGSLVKETPTANGYTESTIASGLTLPSGVALDSSGNIYIASAPSNQLWKVDFTTPPSLAFSSTTYGLTSADSPKAVTIANVGNAALTFPVPSEGSNPAPSANFGVLADGTTPCAVVESTSTSPGTLSAGTSCELSISFKPLAVGALSGKVVLTDSNLNTAGPAYTTQSIPVTGTGTQATSVIDWPTPAPIVFLTNLSGILNATAQSGTTTIPGNFDYTASLAGAAAVPVTSSTLLSVGSYTLTATFHPTVPVDATSATASVPLTVSKFTPSVTLTSSANPAFLSSNITFTATLSTLGMTGTVNFLDGNTQIGSAQIQGAAPGQTNAVVYTTSSLATGPHSITAVYSGDSNFQAVTSAAVAETIEDFSIALASGASSSASASPGGHTSYSFVVTPLDGNTLPAGVNLVATGLPSGATATFSPITIPGNSGTTNVTLSVNLPNQSAALGRHVPSPGHTLPLALGIFVFPFASRLRRRFIRSGARRLSRIALLACLCLVGVASLLTLSGCGGGGSKSTSPVSQTYTLTVTASSGSLSHAATVTLTVQ